MNPEDDQDIADLHDDITGCINRYPHLTAYSVLGMLETVKFSLIEQLPVKTIDRTLKEL